MTAEYERESSVFGVYSPYVAGEKSLPIFGGEKIETPFGPAAGPNTQLAQNIIASYFGGARFFELKTVQKMDGAELSACVSRPCILAEDECYNCEWSTELYVPQAYEEYVKSDVIVTHTVQNRTGGGIAKDRRIAFNEGVEVFFGDQVGRDPFDFIRRTAVEGRDGVYRALRPTGL